MPAPPEILPLLVRLPIVPAFDIPAPPAEPPKPPVIAPLLVTVVIVPAFDMPAPPAAPPATPPPPRRRP
jgi:hypothetical protein